MRCLGTHLGLALTCLGLVAGCLPDLARLEAEPATAPVLIYDPPSSLPAPDGLNATTGQYRQVPLQWDPVLIPHVAGYLVESGESLDGPFTPRHILPHRGALAWVDRGGPLAPLGDGVTHYYRVRAFDHEKRVSRSASRIAVATTAPPVAPPSGLRAYSRQPRSIPLAWDAASDPVVAGYIVERSPGIVGPFEIVAELEGRHTTHFLDTGLRDLAVLFYRVSSVDPSGERGPPSRVLRAVTKPEPLAPIGLRVERQQLGENGLAWEPNVEPDLHSYRLVRLHGDGRIEDVATVDASHTRASDDAVGAGVTYEYGVIAMDQDGLASRTSEPLPVRGLGYEWIARATSDAVHLSWNPRTAEGFVSARVTREGWFSNWTRSVEGMAELVDTPVRPGWTYRYVIQLQRADGGLAPESQPVEIEIPEPEAPFVEIRAPASRLARPEGLPR